MPISRYRWAAVSEFRNRHAELARMQDWWESPDREPLSLYGRRRVGKSWLFRKFAHGKAAVILVADQVAAGQQLDQLAQQLSVPLGLTPRLDTPADLFRVLYQLARTRKILVVIDEFPYLLGTTSGDQQANLTSIQAVLEQERDRSKIKLVLTGSTISVMEDLRTERSPLHGRLIPLQVKPLRFADARLLMEEADPIDQLTRYSIAGGMPRYLTALRGAPLASVLADKVVDRQAQLFNEPRTLLATELREPATYFSILSSLAKYPQSVAAIGADLHIEPRQLSGYLATLETLQLVSRHRPVGSTPDARNTQWRCEDDFIRFWFRFVRRYQDELESGADALAHVIANVVPELADHGASTFEHVVQDWMRLAYAGQVTAVGSWWGPALNSERAAGTRTSEEVDAVALHRRTVIAVAEAKWTNKPMDAAVLSHLTRYKLPAMAQSGLDVTEAEIILTARSGFTAGLEALASTTPKVRLIAAAELLSEV